MALIVTPGASNANSYGTLVEANAYFAAHLYASGWNSVTPTQQEAAMIMARRGLDSMPGAWAGTASSSTQSCGFPRIGLLSRNGYALASGEIPVDLKNAQFEYAQALIASNLNASNDIQNQGITSIKAGPVELKFRDLLTQQEKAEPSNRAYAAMVPDVVLAMIPSHWLTSVSEQQASEGLGLLFETL